MQYLSFIKRCHVFLHFHCFVVSVRHTCSILFATISINFIYYIFWTVATIYIHVSYGLFIHVFKCTYFTIWNKIYVRACTWNLRLMFSDIKCIRVFILFRTCTLSRLEGRGSLSTFINHISSKKRGWVGVLDNYWQVSSGCYMFLLIQGQL